MTTPQNLSISADGFSVASAKDSRTERLIRAKQQQGSLLLSLLFILVVVLLPLIFYTYWVFLEAAVRAWHLPHTQGILTNLFRRNLVSPGGWPFDVAFVLSTLSAWGMLYLGYDTLSLFGNPAIKDALLQKARGIYPYTLEQSPHVFVEIRPADDVSRVRRNRLMLDLGWLFLTPDALVFVGNDQIATIPQERLLNTNRSIQAEIPRFDLSASWVRLPYGSRRSETLQLIVREEAARLSDTGPGAKRLEKALNDWLRRETLDR